MEIPSANTLQSESVCMSKCLFFKNGNFVLLFSFRGLVALASLSLLAFLRSLSRWVCFCFNERRGKLSFCLIWRLAWRRSQARTSQLSLSQVCGLLASTFKLAVQLTMQLYQQTCSFRRYARSNIYEKRFRSTSCEASQSFPLESLVEWRNFVGLLIEFLGKPNRKTS